MVTLAKIVRRLKIWEGACVCDCVCVLCVCVRVCLLVCLYVRQYTTTWNIHTTPI